MPRSGRSASAAQSAAVDLDTAVSPPDGPLLSLHGGGPLRRRSFRVNKRGRDTTLEGVSAAMGRGDTGRKKAIPAKGCYRALFGRRKNNVSLSESLECNKAFPKVVHRWSICHIQSLSGISVSHLAPKHQTQRMVVPLYSVSPYDGLGAQVGQADHCLRNACIPITKQSGRKLVIRRVRRALI